MVAVAVTVIDARFTTETSPQLVARVGVAEPAQVKPGLVPATYRVLPERNPKVPASTGIVGPTRLLFTSNSVMLAVVPPHCGPQFRMYAVESSLLKVAQTGWSKRAL